MRYFKIWLILLSIGLIVLDKYSFISNLRDSTVIFMQKKISLIAYRVTNYPRLVFLQTKQQQELAKQNNLLKKQVEQYSLLLQQSQNKNQDIQALKNLNSAGLYDDFTQVVSKAILDVNFFVNNQLLIDKGKSSNLTVGDAVVNRDGVVGQITSVNLNNSQVIMITNPEFKIYLENGKTKTKMLAQGAGNNSLIVKYIDKKDSVKVGDILFTTGLDDVYPANLPVVKVVKVFYENNGFNSALCYPVVDFHQLQYVVVLKNDHK